MAAGGTSLVDEQIAVHPGQSGAYVLESAEEALLARAWLADHAERSIEVQYFIWSTDNIGILAAEALLRAAERGVRVRVIVDALLLDAPDRSLLALARHPKVEVRIYNPRRFWSVLTDFRGLNQRMHDKTLVVDGKVAITGGRNMAAEYYDYNHEYNFRDRDVLLLGKVAGDVRASFERFWASELSVPVEDLYAGLALDAEATAAVYRDLHAYARDPANFAPEVRGAIAATPEAFPRIAAAIAWGAVEFIADRPGKNEARGLGGGGETTAALARLVTGARRSVVIQSPYLVLSDAALEVFRDLRKRGVGVRVSTNSLASTDNVQAFSGYRNQRRELLAMGLQVFEYRPDAQVQRLAAPKAKAPVFALHAKTLVVDSQAVYIGTFNLDPRSENLNTEVGVILRDARLARAVEAAIETDMRPENAWNAATDSPDSQVSLFKRTRTRFWQLLPLRPIL